MNHVTIRDYGSEGDDAACKELEKRASQHKFRNAALEYIKSALFSVHIKHLQSFDAKARQFEKGVVLVAEVERQIAGVMCMGIKRVYLGGTAVLAAYLFDLRVSESHQRCGIGARLVRAGEQRCVELGVGVAYLTVNTDNYRAIALYKKDGYYNASRRCLCFSPLLGIPRPPGAFLRCKGGATAHARQPTVVRSLSAAQAIRLVQGAYGGTDLAPVPNFRDLFMGDGTGARGGSSRLLGAWIGVAGTVATAEPTESIVAQASSLLTSPSAAAGDCSVDPPPAAVTTTTTTTTTSGFASVLLWDGDGYTDIQVDRLILRPSTWMHPLTRGVAWGLVLLGLAAGIRWTVRLAAAEMWITAAIVMMACIVGVGVTAFARHALRFVTTRRRLRARLIAPIAHGPEGIALLQDVAARAKDQARLQGFAVCIANIDVDSPLRAAFSSSKPRARTVFMQKRLSSAFPSPPPLFDPGAFFDPRDLS